RGQRAHHCHHCNILLLTGKKIGFCCGPNGAYINNFHPLPPLPHKFDVFLKDPQISELSHILNSIFSFVSMETTAQFPDTGGDYGFITIQGKV
ncbi:uncharacterized protein PHACADRAFT_108727, partial [Phanerochaete carnosa HHB-10118-sp]